MKQILLIIFISTILTACSNKPFEEYKDYYYEYKNDDKLQRFTYVLYLGEEGDNLNEHNELNSPTPERHREKSSSRSRRAGEDDFISLSFRMEEEAFKRLDLRFSNNEFCSVEPIIESNKYTWLRYSIKGYCEN